MRELGIALLATVLGNIVSHYVIKALDKRCACRKDSPKHMRQGY